MSNFTVRVELRNSQDADYTELHELMALRGFSRTLNVSYTDSSTGYVSLQCVVLPTAEYNYQSDTATAKDVAELAAHIAENIRHNPMVLVTKSSSTSERFIQNPNLA